MNRSTLRQLREWLQIRDAATELSLELRESVSEADVLRLGLDGLLILSVFLPVPVKTACYEADEQGTPVEEGQRFNKEIIGLCDIPMANADAREEVETRYQLLLQNYVPRNSVGPAALRQGAVWCSLPAERRPSGDWSRSSFPQGSVLCVRRKELETFVAAHGRPSDVDSKLEEDRPLGTKERTTLLLMIDTLAAAADIDINRASKAGGIIAAMMNERGHEFSAHAIAGHLRELKKILNGAEDVEQRD